MRKIIGSFLLGMMLLSTIAFATERTEEENYDDLIQLISEQPITQTETIEDDLYQMQQDISITQTINGNIYVMAQDLEIKGATIYGNVYAMAQNIKIENAEITGSLYLMAENIEFAGVTNDFYALAEFVSMPKESIVWRNARIGANRLQISGNIGKNLYTSVETLEVLDTAVIAGKLNYFSKRRGMISEMAQVGEVGFEQMQEVEETYQDKVNDYVLESIKVIVKTLIIALLILFLSSKFQMLPRKDWTDLLKSMCKGIGVLVVFPVLAFLLVISIVASVLGISLFAIYGILLYIALPVVALELAHRIVFLKKNEHKGNKGKIILVAILIALAIWGISYIPAIGRSIKFLILLIGLGIIFDLLFKKVKNEPNNGEDK